MSILKKLIFDRSFWWIRHSLFWVVLYLDTFRYIFGLDGEWELVQLRDDFLTLGLDMALVYLNIYVLIPRLALKDKMPSYLLLTLLSLVIVLIINSFQVEFYLEEGDEYPFLWRMYDAGIATAGIIGPAIAIKTSKYFYEQSIKASSLQEEKLQSELTYLKKQINPHFLFNSLNNIYILAKEQSAKTADYILQLSDLMRYQTYDSQKETITLTKELEFIDNYLQLELLRRENLKIEKEITGPVTAMQIEPLLFLPFIENACKYSAKTDGQEEKIDIKIQVSLDEIKLQVKNDIGHQQPTQGSSGFGLDNVRKRLALLYPESHELNITERTDSYEVSLKIMRS